MIGENVNHWETMFLAMPFEVTNFLDLLELHSQFTTPHLLNPLMIRLCMLSDVARLRC